MSVLLVWTGFLCFVIGLSYTALGMVELFVRLNLAMRPQPGMGPLMMAVGAIAIRMASR